jgi:GntR family transcriptional regulator, transcriptional repressor for pyruvate dehydrogenase complex
VSPKKNSSTIEAAASRLRTIALAAKDGALLGSEDALVADLGVSRATMRQVARLLEREGLLRVRRGINGGYFGTRPDVSTVETAVSAYLDTLDMDPEELIVIASVLWVEVLRKASSLRTKTAKAVASRLREKLTALRPNAPISDIVKLEEETRTAIFDLIKGRYIELIFHINIAFAQRHFLDFSDTDEKHSEFVHLWRNAKLMELEAIMDGDPDLGILAARHSRNLWHRRVWRRHK